MEDDDVNSTESPPPRQSPWLRVGIGLALVAALLLIGAGYLIGTGLGDDDAPATAQAGGDPMQYVTCMRKNGVANFPDPEGGRLRLSPQDGVDPQSPAFKSAEAACESVKPAEAPDQAAPNGQPVGAGAGSLAPSFQAAPIDTKDYVACMRKNGVPDFPDPVNGMFTYDARTDAARAADAICRKFLPSDAPPPPK